MPNYVINKVTCDNMDELKKLLLNKDENVDFNIIIPKPKDLDIASGSHSYDIQSRYFHTEEAERKLAKQRRIIGNVLEILYNNTMTQEEFVKKVMADEKLIKKIKAFKGWYSRKSKNIKYAMKKKELTETLENYIKGFFNIKRYGKRDWYDWSIENWGTKWNACATVVDSDAIEFQTAWSTPIPVFVELSKRLKDITITVDYADEDIGSNCGTLEILNGAVSRYEPDNPEKFACDIWGYDYAEYCKECEEYEESNNDE